MAVYRHNAAYGDFVRNARLAPWETRILQHAADQDAGSIAAPFAGRGAPDGIIDLIEVNGVYMSHEDARKARGL